jgi:protein-L-isoaspartate(D-aspartate) O-methyltransferase
MPATQDFTAARTNMVEGQIRPNKVIDSALVEALRQVPRERFVPPALRGVAYVDEDVAIGQGRYLMEPMVFARLAQEARIGPRDTVLDVGCGSGYSAAVLARLAGTVIALEQDRTLADEATRQLQEQGVGNALVVAGPLAVGYPGRGPYDAILVEGCVAQVPQALLDQLAEGGRLVAVISETGHLGQVRLFEKIAGVVSGRTLFEAAVRPLPGFEAPPRFEF